MLWFLIAFRNTATHIYKWYSQFDNFFVILIGLVAIPLFFTFLFLLLFYFAYAAYYQKRPFLLKKVVVANFLSGVFAYFPALTFIYLGLLLPPTFAPFLFVAAVTIPIFLIYRFSAISTPFELHPSQKLSFSILAGIVGLLAVPFSAFWHLYEPCWPELNHSLAFNQHIKELCYLRSDTSECPKNESELIAFNPHKYNQLKQCAEVKYSYNHETKSPSFTLDPFVISQKSRWNIISKAFPSFTDDEKVTFYELQNEGGND